MATHTIEIGKKPYIQAEIKKVFGRLFFICEYSEKQKAFMFTPQSSDFSEWLEEEQIDEATALLSKQMQEWTDEVDEQDDEEAERDAEDWEQTKKHINDNWSSY